MKTVALLTKHRKSQQLAPVLYEIGIELVEIDFFDTDQLGTFLVKYPENYLPENVP